MHCSAQRHAIEKNFSDSMQSMNEDNSVGSGRFRNQNLKKLKFQMKVSKTCSYNFLNPGRRNFKHFAN